LGTFVNPERALLVILKRWNIQILGANPKKNYGSEKILTVRLNQKLAIV